MNAAVRRHLRPLLACALAALFLGGAREPLAALAGGSLAVFTVSPADGSTVSGQVVWQADASRGGVDAVEFYIDGQLRWTERHKPFVFNGGTWDTTREKDGAHTLGLRLIAKSGEATSSSTVTIANSSSSGGTPPPPPPPPADTSAPSTPGSLTRTGATETAVSVAWQPSSDNVGVAGYGVYRDGVAVGTASATTYSFAGLKCGTAYSLAVDAFDAAGNRSAAATLSASTSACPVVASVFLSPTGSDANACSASAPCKTLKRAYGLARLGDVVELAAGVYPGELLTGTKGSPDTDDANVVFRPAAGAIVHVAGNVGVQVAHVEFRDMEIDKWNVRYDDRDRLTYGGGDVTFRNVKTHSATVLSAWNVRVLGGELGPNRNPVTGDWPEDGLYVGAWPTFDGHHPRNLVLDGVLVHDVTMPTSTAHSDCIQFTAGENVVVRNSKFLRCQHADVMLAPDQGPVYGFLFENNWFDKTLSAYYAINADSKGSSLWRNVAIRYNTELQGSRLTAPGLSYTDNVRVGGLSDSSCSQAKSAGIAVDWNLFTTGTPCGSHDRIGDPRFADPASFDLRLLQGSAAVDAADPASYPTGDIEGRPRPAGPAPDIGADELQ